MRRLKAKILHIIHLKTSGRLSENLPDFMPHQWDFASGQHKTKNSSGKWVEQYTEQVEDMNRFYQTELEKSENDRIGKVIIEEFPAFYERANKRLKD